MKPEKSQTIQLSNLTIDKNDYDGDWISLWTKSGKHMRVVKEEVLSKEIYKLAKKLIADGHGFYYK